MSWLAVDKNNQEYIFDKKPYRIKNKKYLHDLESSLKNLNPNLDFKDLYEYEEIHWGIKQDNTITKDDYSIVGPLGILYLFSCRLPEGTIEKLIGYKLTWEDEPIEYNKTLYNLNMNVLTRKFPNFIFRDGCAEIIGYDPKNHIHMVIEDGCCCTTDNKWLVHQYKIKNPEFFNWLEWKYICDNEIAEKILEERIEFN